MREIVFGQDGNFSYDALIDRYNSDLANGLGNLASRHADDDQAVSPGCDPGGGESAISGVAVNTIAATIEAFDNLDSRAGWSRCGRCWGRWTSSSSSRRPWKLVKQADAQEQLSTTLYTAAEVLRIAAVLLYPVIPESTEKIWSQLRHDGEAGGCATGRAGLGPTGSWAEDRRDQRRLPAHRREGSGGEDQGAGD